MTTVTWVLTDLKYEISSKDHLLQLMSNGTLYTDAGSPPTSYWEADYIQTVEIDLVSDASITPIGTLVEPFTGSYDGSSFSITDWSYTSTTDNTGLFGYISGSTLSNINMEGTWNLTTSGLNCGFLVGTVVSSSVIYNITGDFSSGFILSTGNIVGGLIGSADSSIIEGLTMKGVLSSIISPTDVGGIACLLTDCTFKYVRNMVRFTSDPAISASSECGGIAKTVTDCIIQYIMNAMIGNISGNDVGGVFLITQTSTSGQISHIVNSMVGNINGTRIGAGISGWLLGMNGTVSYDSFVNYMKGDITGTEPGGISSRVQGSGSGGQAILTNSVIAMNGNVLNAGSPDLSNSSTMALQIITDFGLVYTNTAVTTILTDITGLFAPHTDFPELEYFPFEFSDSQGTSYLWEFVFANVGGSASYSEYTHFVISSQNVAGPIELQLTLPDNLTEYIHKLNTTDNEITIEDGLVVVYSSGTVFDSSDNILYPIPSTSFSITSPFSASITWVSVDDATSYKIEYAVSGSTVKSTSESTTELTMVLYNLVAETTYDYQLYYSEDDITYVIDDDSSGSITTPANIASNYDLSVFLEEGVYNLSGFSPDTIGNISTIITELLGQDESIKIIVNGSIDEILVSGISGETIDVGDKDSYILPFQTTIVSPQTIDVTGLYTGTMTYDETQDGIEIDGTLRFAGDSFILDGVRITIKSV